MFRLAFASFVLVTLGSAWAALRPAQDMQMPKPTPEHAELLKAVGEWEGTMTMQVPDMPADPTPCHETVTGVGAFWTTSTFTCELMGMPFVGSGAMGYDTQKKAYVGTWIDGFTSRLTVMEGNVDPAKKALVMRYEGPDPATGKIVPHRIETVHEGPDAYTSTFFMGAGEGQKHMTISMKRKK